MKNVINEMSVEGKLLAVRAVGNSALFRAFYAFDAMASADPEAYEKLSEKADNLCSVVNTLSDLLREKAAHDQYAQIMEVKDMLELISTTQEIDNDKQLGQLAELLGESVDELRKMRDKALEQRAKDGATQAKRSGEQFAHYLAQSTPYETVEEALELFDEHTNQATLNVVRKSLTRTFNRALQRGLTSSDGSGLSEVFALKQDIDKIDHARNFDL